MITRRKALVLTVAGVAMAGCKTFVHPWTYDKFTGKTITRGQMHEGLKLHGITAALDGSQDDVFSQMSLPWIAQRINTIGNNYHGADCLWIANHYRAKHQPGAVGSLFGVVTKEFARGLTGKAVGKGHALNVYWTDAGVRAVDWGFSLIWTMEDLLAYITFEPGATKAYSSALV